MNKYPAKPMMDEMAKYGRYGDSMLVHMNPIEVAGIASLSPTGKLTTNPVTGQPEAFLPLLAPLLGVAGGALGLSTLGTAALTGIGTAAVTGDLKRGLISGLTAGVSSGIGDLLTEGAQAGVEAATTNLSDTALNQAIEGTAGTLESGVARALEGATGSVPGMGGDIAGQLAETKASMAAAGLNTAPTDIAGQLAQSQTAMNAALEGVPQPSAFDNFSGRVDDLVGGLGTQGQLVGGLVGSSMLEQMDVQDDYEAQQRALEQESEEKRMRAYQDLQGAYRAAQPGVASGMSPMRAGISNLIPAPYVPGMAEGGETSSLIVEPTEEEALVLAKARQGALSPEDQVILQGYYSRRNEQIAANEQAEQEAADAERGVVDGVLRIPAGTTNQEALNILYRAGMIREQDYSWFNRHFRETGQGTDTYYASDSFPGIDKYLENSGFNDENKARVTRVLTALDSAQTDGIREEDLAGLTDGQMTRFGFFGLGGNTGYGGIDPISIQAGLRARHSVAPPPDYMTGFEPEFSYFQDDPENISIPTRMFRPTTSGIESEGDYFDPILDKEAYLEQLRDYYRRLAGYTPAEVDYPEESDPIEDDPDVVGDPAGGEFGGGGSYGGPFKPVFERGVSLVTGKRWKDMSESEKIAHAYMRGESSWYGDKEGSPAWDEAMAYIDEKFGDRVGDYMSAFRAEAIERAMAGNAGFTVQEMLNNAGYNSLDDFMSSDTSELQRELLGKRDYHTRPDEYTLDQSSAGSTGGGSGGSTGGGSGGSTGGGVTFGGGLTFGGGSETGGSGGSTGGGLTFGGGSVAGGSSGSTGGGSSSQTSSGNTKAEQWEQAASNPYGFSDAQQAAFDSMTSSERWNADGSVNMDWWNSLSPKQQRTIWFEGTTGGFGLGDTDMHRAMKASMDEAYRSNLPEPEPSDFTFGGGMAEGGMTDKVMLRTATGDQPIEAGGIANVPTGMNAAMPTEEEFNMVAAAIMGMTEEADAIIDMFVRKYGSEMFMKLREMILKEGVPGAQTEGMIEGPGGGMDDMVGGMIGAEQPVAVSPGEYIVPADVVSGLGDGSSDAGARELDSMMDRVRMARGGTARQAPPIDASRIMPA